MDASARCGIDLTRADESEETIAAPSDEAVSTAVVAAVADAKDVDPLDLEPLYETVDPDALDALFSGACGSPTEVSFTFAGFEVVVRGADDVAVTAPVQQAATGATSACGD